MRIEDWFLTAAERGNPAYGLPDWSVGNAVVPHVHGSAYFARLVDVVSALDPDDHLFFTDWRGDADERMRPEGPTVGTLFGDAAKRGVVVKGLVWRSHHDEMSYSEEQNRHLSDDVNEAGGEVLLDQRVRRAGSHHQKTVVVRAAGRDVAFAGGIDLCHTRRDDASHHGDPQVVPMAKEYGERPPWHDVQLELRGPVVGLLDGVFRERWNDPRSLDTDNPLSWLKDRLRHVDLTPDPLPAQPPDPPEAGAVRRPGAAHLPRDPAQDALRPARRAVGGPRLPQGVPPGAPADVRRRPVHVVAAHRPAARRRADEATRSCTSSSSCRGTPTSTAGSRCHRTRSGGWRRSGSWRRSHRTACTCSTWRTPRARRSTCTRRSASSTTCGRARAAPTSTAAPGATTGSCRARSWTTRGTTGSRATRPGSATAPAASPATCG